MELPRVGTNTSITPGVQRFHRLVASPRCIASLHRTYIEEYPSAVSIAVKPLTATNSASPVATGQTRKQVEEQSEVPVFWQQWLHERGRRYRGP